MVVLAHRADTPVTRPKASETERLVPCRKSPMPSSDRCAPRALLVRPLITLDVTPSELHRLVRSIEADALTAIDEGKDDYADYLLRRCAELREAAR